MLNWQQICAPPHFDPPQVSLVPRLFLMFALVISTLGGIWSLRHLCIHHKYLQNRLIWVQLVALMSTDLVFSLFKFAEESLSAAQIFGFGSPCFDIPISFLEFTSCFLEVQIASGFCMACFGLLSSKLLTLAIPLAFVCALVLGIFTLGPQVYVRREMVVVTALCIASFFYMCGCLRICRLPLPLRRRAQLRSLSYWAGFACTFGPSVLLHSFDCFHPYVAQTCLYLNGAFNSGIYLSSVVRLLERRDDATMESIEGTIIASYFELYRFENDTTSSLSRDVAVAVAEARDVMGQQS